MKVELIVSKNFLSLFTVEIVSQAVKAFSKANSAKLELKIVWEDEVEFPVLKIAGFPPIVVKTPPSLSEVLNMLTLALDLSELSQAPYGIVSAWEADTIV
ncbi:hypothetical protein IMZ38_03355 [Thermosphaera chiliense]|uniref:Uncharacterized protein n=1 Tax=Thermosphaera chiliense TaxID=3402707 RepID=A0A7M1URQ4_9CREN|nr:hypothetical protein [Thermosphaera aggregans]QOR94955.1 hypothetical protein IMZ38_03355 [Thermosphaera aggregans]